uniref:Uncharacterized protein n=1 Tax=Ciona savignyi TaxID=51511 RepID=H2Z3I8_CIOSA
ETNLFIASRESSWIRTFVECVCGNDCCYAKDVNMESQQFILSLAHHVLINGITIKII